jgi:hypothetical protein
MLVLALWSLSPEVLLQVVVLLDGKPVTAYSFSGGVFKTTCACRTALAPLKPHCPALQHPHLCPDLAAHARNKPMHCAASCGCYTCVLIWLRARVRSKPVGSAVLSPVS